jgi:hypothetical protein
MLITVHIIWGTFHYIVMQQKWSKPTYKSHSFHSLPDKMAGYFSDLAASLSNNTR